MLLWLPNNVLSQCLYNQCIMISMCSPKMEYPIKIYHENEEFLGKIVGCHRYYQTCLIIVFQKSVG